ncbi:MAG: amidohydrolase family protein [Melioribacteraceae bacterium]|nr:amidohydrolase family protein [Melioribacteraceae bacterium]
MEKNKVDHSVILTSYKVSEHRPSIAEVVSAVSGYKNLSVVAGISFVNYKERDLREIADYLKDGLLKGLKLYPGYEPFYPYDKRCKVIYDLAAEFKVPVMIHSGDTFDPKGKVRYAHPIAIDDVAVDNPDVNFVICHLGNPWIRDCMEVVYKNKNVYTDISGLVLGDFHSKFEKYMKSQVEEMILFAGEPKYMLYGTDWPIANMETYISFLNNLKLPEERKELIACKNSAKLFNIDI